MNLLTLPVFIAVLAVSIILHELGHYLAARWMKIEVEEFGVGIPPRLFRFWRLPGLLRVGKTAIRIPANFKGNLSRQDLENRVVEVTLNKNSKDEFILQSLRLADTEDGQALLASPNLSQTGPEEYRLSGTAHEVRPGTEFTFNAIPLGGFVRPRGENDPNIPGGLASAPPLRRIFVLAAGPLMNLLTAFVLFVVIISQQGLPTPGVVNIVEVLENSPAQQAGFQVGDRLLAVNQTNIQTVDSARAAIRAGVDTPIRFSIQRGGETLSLSATPLSSREAPLGVSLSSPLRPTTLGEALLSAGLETSYQTANTFLLPALVIQGAITPEQARPVGLFGMYSMFDQAVQRDVETRQEAQTPTPAAAAQPSADQPTNWTLSLAAMLSISLGVINLYPIPALDGGRILFSLPELLFRRRLPTNVENYLNGAAFLLLIMLMLLINSFDIFAPANFVLPK